MAGRHGINMRIGAYMQAIERVAAVHRLRGHVRVSGRGRCDAPLDSLLAVGKLRPSYREACDDYLRRLGRLPHGARGRGPRGQPGAHSRGPARGGGEPAPRASCRPAPARGARPDRRGLEQRGAGPPARALAAGGPAGGPRSSGARTVSIRRSSPRRADRWSLGPLTLPHELARVVVAGAALPRDARSCAANRITRAPGPADDRMVRGVVR